MTPKQEKKFKSEIESVCKRYGFNEFMIASTKDENEEIILHLYSNAKKGSNTLIDKLANVFNKTIKTWYVLNNLHQQ